VWLAGTEIEGVEEAIHANAGSAAVAPPPRLPQPTGHALVVVDEFLPIDLLQIHGLIVTDPLQDLLQPQAGGRREPGTDRRG
jgi:hypothetical protein